MDWSQIDDKRFEELACAYASDIYRNYTWIPTGKSWDGNTDARFRDKIDGINYYYKGWCEAKYTCDPDSSIPKSHMDSTLVSGILDGEVIFILFVTNGKITPSFMQRASAILRPHKIQIKFVEGDVLTDWINDNPAIRDTFFTGRADVNYRHPAQLKIIDCCILDAIMSAPSLVSRAKRLTAQNEYFLYLNIHSTHKTNYNLTLSTKALKLLPNAKWEDTVMPGYNSVLIKCYARFPFEGTFCINLQAEDGNTFTSDPLPLAIEDADDEKIIYAKQELYIQEIYESAKSNIYRNTILALAGHEGSGKTHLLNQLILSLANENAEILRLCFSDKEAENASSICKLLLFINFGFLYDLSQQAFTTLINRYTELPSDVFLQLREGASDQITALNSVDTVSNLLKTTEIALFPDKSPMSRHSVSYIVIDDFYKATDRHKAICEHILEEFSSRNYAQMMIIGYRTGEFRVPSLENTLNHLHTGVWKLSGVSSQDVFDSLRACFNEDVARLAKLFPTPVSVLHLDLLLKKLKHSDILHRPREKRAVIYSTAYKETNVNDTGLVINKIRGCRYKDILYVVYKIESGVPTQLLRDFFGKEYNAACATFSSDTLVREEHERLKPYHDIYLNAFTQLSFSPTYLDRLNLFLQYCIEKEVNDPILTSNILSILIDRSNGLRSRFLAYAKTICQKYYAQSQYIAAQNLAIALLPDLEHTPHTAFSYDDLELLYIYAQSVKYSNTHVDSSKYLEMISDIGNMISLDPYEMGVVYEAHSELITNDLYSMDFKSVEKELDYFKKSIRDVDKASSEHTVNAFLNFKNRNMLYAYFTGLPGLRSAYEEARNESTRLERDDYEAYAKMDYAKIIFRENPSDATSLLNEALPTFEKYPKCKKRQIDCLFEIAVIEYLTKNGSLNQLYALQRLARDNGFKHVYARITITILTGELINGGDPKDIEIKLDKLIVEYTDLQRTNRLNYFVNQLLAAICNRQGNYKGQAKYLRQQQISADVFPKSYGEIVEHNFNVNASAAFAWSMGGAADNASTFLLDPRIW